MFDKAPKGLEKLQWTPEKAKASKKRALKRHKKNVKNWQNRVKKGIM